MSLRRKCEAVCEHVRRIVVEPMETRDACEQHVAGWVLQGLVRPVELLHAKDRPVVVDRIADRERAVVLAEDVVELVG